MKRFVGLIEVTRLEFAEIRRSRWLAMTLIVYGVLVGIFVLVGLRESSVLGFTGLGRVLLNFSHALIALLPLLALSATVQVVPRAREDGSLELLMSQPVSRFDYFAGVALSRMIALIAPLILLALGMAIFGGPILGGELPWNYLGMMLLAASTLIIAFVGIGMMISVFGKNQSRSLIYALVVWALGIAFLDFAIVALMLQWRIEPAAVFTLAVVNPVECARLLLLSSAEPELNILGPVGFFLANRLGIGWLAVIGALWPTCLGFGMMWGAWSQFKRSDLLA
ncbi:MAG: ABC transporter permease subunit [Chrysiogenetes bacterium]|nr:ABC transporter permease subunit [Chrysiogenetes bacterium]